MPEDSWIKLVVKALEELNAYEKPAEIAAIYEAVRRIAPERCRDDDLYISRHDGRVEPRWKRDVRDALVKLKNKGVAINEKKGAWRLIKQACSRS